MSSNRYFFMQNLLGKSYEKILLPTSINFRGDYIIISIFLGWQFVVGEYVGGILLILAVWLLVKLTCKKEFEEKSREHAKKAEGGDSQANSKEKSWKDKIVSKAGWHQVASRYTMEWKMVWKDGMERCNHWIHCRRYHCGICSHLIFSITFHRSRARIEFLFANSCANHRWPRRGLFYFYRLHGQHSASGRVIRAGGKFRWSNGVYL